MPWKGKKMEPHISNAPGQPHSLHPGYRPSIVPWNSDCHCKFREEMDPSHQPWEFGSSDRNFSGTTDVSLQAWRGAFKATHISPPQAAFTSSPVFLKQHFSWLLSEICLPQETSRLSSRIKSKFSLQLLPASLCSVQIADLKILDESKEAKSKKGVKEKMFWQPSSHQWNWRKPYHMNHLKIRSVWTQPWKMYRGEQACIGGGMNRMS